MRILLYFDQMDVDRLSLVNAYLTERDYVHENCGEHELHLINARNRKLIEITCAQGFLTAEAVPYHLPCPDDSLTLIALSHLGLRHHVSEQKSMEHFAFNARPIVFEKSLQLTLLKYWQVLHAQPCIAAASARSEGLLRLISAVKSDAEKMRALEHTIRDGCHA